MGIGKTGWKGIRRDATKPQYKGTHFLIKKKKRRENQLSFEMNCSVIPVRKGDFF